MPDRLNACRSFTTLLCAAFTIVASFSCARAASHEQIIESCRQAHTEELRACVRGKVGNPRDAIGGELEKARQACGAAIVRPCVLREEQKQAAGVAAPAAPKDAAAAPDVPLDIRASFVAPSRTIADITAILDSEKPDEAQIAKRKATADAAPAHGLAGPQLAQFLFDRAAVRALLARNKEALADGLQALELGKHGMDLRFLARTRRLVALQYKATGDPKDAIAILKVQVGEGDVPGRRGTIISSLRGLAQILISVGDVSQANAYVGRAEAMVSEARGSPNPKWRAAYPIYGHGWGRRRYRAGPDLRGARTICRGRDVLPARRSLRARGAERSGALRSAGAAARAGASGGRRLFAFHCAQRGEARQARCRRSGCTPCAARYSQSARQIHPDDAEFHHWARRHIGGARSLQRSRAARPLRTRRAAHDRRCRRGAGERGDPFQPWQYSGAAAKHEGGR